MAARDLLLALPSLLPSAALVITALTSMRLVACDPTAQNRPIAQAAAAKE